MITLRPIHRLLTRWSQHFDLKEAQQFQQDAIASAFLQPCGSLNGPDNRACSRWKRFETRAVEAWEARIPADPVARLKYGAEVVLGIDAAYKAAQDSYASNVYRAGHKSVSNPIITPPNESPCRRFLEPRMSLSRSRIWKPACGCLDESVEQSAKADFIETMDVLLKLARTQNCGRWFRHDALSKIFQHAHEAPDPAIALIAFIEPALALCNDPMLRPPWLWGLRPKGEEARDALRQRIQPHEGIGPRNDRAAEELRH